MSPTPKNLSLQAQLVWKATTIENKREQLIKLLDDCRFQKNLGKIEREVQNINTTSKRLDQIAANLMLCDTDKVIK